MAHKVLEQREAKKVTAEDSMHIRGSGDVCRMKPVREWSVWSPGGWEVYLGIASDFSSASSATAM